MKVVLTIAGSDCSGGAGIQADLKTFEAFGVFGCSVITVLTAQNTQGVTAIEEIKSSFIKEQIEAILKDFDVSCIKIGMLFSNEIIDTVKECIKDLNIPVIFDPVFVSKAGSKLLNDDAIENLKTLLPYCILATPNKYEAKELFSFEFSNKKEQNNSILAPCEVLVKNNIKDKGDYKISVDTLFTKETTKNFISEYIETDNTHGTGCSFSSAIASNIALGKTIEESIEISKKFIYEAILHAPSIGKGKGPIAHKIGEKYI